MGALRILAAGVAVIVVSAIPGFLPGSLAPRIAGDFRFGSAELGVVVAGFYAVSALASVPAGNLVDRIGASSTLRLTCAVAATTMFGAALLGRSTATLAVIVGLSGAGNAMCTPGSAALIATSLRARWRGLGYGAAQGGASWGSLLAGLALPGIAIPFGWRWVFVSAAALAVLVGFAVPGGVSRPVADQEGPSAVGRLGPERSAAARLRPANYLMALAAALAATASVSMVSFLVLYSLRVGLDERQAGFLLALIGFTGAVGRPCAGLLGGRRGGGPALAWASVFLCVGSIGFLLLATGYPGALVLGALLAGGVGASWSGLGTLATTAAAPGRPAAAVGVMMTGLFTGAVGGPLMAGQVSGHAGYQVVWALNACLALAAVGVLLMVRRWAFSP